MLVNVGHENCVASAKVIAVGKPNSAPIKRAVVEGRKHGIAIDLCAGKACRSVLFMENRQIVLSSLRPRIVRERLNRAALLSKRIALEGGADWADDTVSEPGMARTA